MPVADNNVTRKGMSRSGSNYTSVGSHMICSAGVKIPLILLWLLKGHCLEVGGEGLLVPTVRPITAGGRHAPLAGPLALGPGQEGVRLKGRPSRTGRRRGGPWSGPHLNGPGPRVVEIWPRSA